MSELDAEYLRRKELRKEAAEKMYKALTDAKLQIQYLHGKFQATGTGIATLARIQDALDTADGK